MWIYFGIIIWIVVVDFFYRRAQQSQVLENKMKIKCKYSFVAGLPIFIVMAFRAPTIGNDTSIYVQYFNEIKRFSFKEILIDNFAVISKIRMEKGYLLFTKFISLISENEILFLSILSCLMLLCVINFLVHNSEDPILGLYLYFTIGLFSFMMTGIRQSLAMCICLLALEEAKKRHLIKFLLLVFLAFTFHKSSIIFIIVYFVVNQKLTVIKSFLAFVLTFVLIEYLEPIQEFFNETFDYGYSIEKTGNGQIFLIIMIVLLVFTLGKYRENIEKDKDSIVLYNMQVMCVIFWVLRLFTRTVERPSYYFMFSILALVPNSICGWNKKRNRVIIIMSMISLFAMLFIYRTAGDPMLTPYVFVWE